MQTFTSHSHHSIVSLSESAAADTKIVGAVQAKQDAILEMLRTLITRVDQLEKKVRNIRGMTTRPARGGGYKQ